MNVYLFFFVFISRPNSLQLINVLAFLFMVFVFVHNKLTQAE